MARLKIDLQEGFQNDSVALLLDDAEVFRESGISTRLQIGLAESVELDVEEGAAVIKILLPNRNLDESISLVIQEDTFVGISLSDGRLKHEISNRPFGYL